MVLRPAKLHRQVGGIAGLGEQPCGNVVDDLGEPIAALPLTIYEYAKSPYDEWHAKAWAGSLVLIALVLALSLVARAVTRGRHTGGD